MIALNTKRKYIAIFLSIFLILTFVNISVAVDMDELNRELERQEEPVRESPNLVWDFIKMFIVLAIILFSAWFIIRMFSEQLKTKIQGRWLNVVDEIVLGQNKGIILCEVAGRIYAIGVSDHQINLMFEINDPHLIQEISETQLEDKDELPIDKMKKTIGEISNIFKNNFSQNDKAPQKFHTLMKEQSEILKDLETRVSNTQEQDLPQGRSGNNE